LLWTAACGTEGEWKELQASPPLSRIDYSGHEIGVFPAPGVETWSVTAYPYHATAKDFLHPAILKYLDSRVERIDVTLVTEGETAFTVDLGKGLRVEAIKWVKPAHSLAPSTPAKP